MKVQELLTNLKNRNFDMEKELQVKTYLPIKEKQMIAQLIINECTEEVDGVVRLDSVQQYLSYVKYMIKMHTCLEYTDEDYDVLCSTEYEGNSLLTIIMGIIGEDTKECTRILRLMINDYLQSNSIEMSVGKFLNNLTTSVGGLSYVFSNMINELNVKNLIPEDMDIEMLKNIVSIK